MRDLLFKNLTSNDRKRKIIASREISDKHGIRSTIHRHFVCMVKEIKSGNTKRPAPYLYVLKQRHTKEHKEGFFCRIKGSVFAVNKDRLFLVLFMHSLKINLEAIPASSMGVHEG